MAYLGKITANVQKRLKSVSFNADFLYDENIDHTKKKPSKCFQFLLGGFKQNLMN